jgi:hypothetical protein
LNVDPIHDGWFSAPAIALAGGGVPYRDVVTSYGWFTPVFLAAIIEIFGFQLLYVRLTGLLILICISVISILIAKRSIGLNKSLLTVSIWLLIGLGQMTKNPLAFPAWGLWPNLFIILGTLLLIYLLLCTDNFGYPILTAIALIAGLAPWVRAQGILVFASSLFVFTVRIYQSNSSNKSMKVLQLFSFSFIVFSTPFIYLYRNGAIDEWLWQTIEMPRTGEWVGIPEPAEWIIQNFGTAIFLTLGLFFVSLVFRLLKISFNKLVIPLALVLILISLFPISKAPLDGFLLVRKVHSLLYLYTNYNFFTLPILITLSASLFLVFRLLQKVLTTRGRILLEMPSLVAMLGIPPVTLVYYNFGHLWGVAPLLFLSILHYLKQNGEFVSRFRHLQQIAVVYSILVALIAVPQVYTNLAKPTFAYSASGLIGMRGQDNQRVVAVRNAIQSLSQLPEQSKVFFLCKDAIYSTIEGRYLSDNLFYSSIMTRFDRRSSSYREPSTETNFVVYCPGSNTVSISELRGNWVLSDLTDNTPQSGLQIYERK